MDPRGYYGSMSSPEYGQLNNTSQDQGQNLMAMSDFHTMPGDAMASGGTLDDIINSNRKELERRQSFQHPSYSRNMGPPHARDPRRASMMEFGSNSGNNLGGFQFDSGPVSNGEDIGMNNLGAHMQVSGVGDASPAFNPLQYSNSFQPSLDGAENFDFENASKYGSSSMHSGLQNTPVPMEFSPAGMEPGSSGDGTPATNFSSNAVSQHLPDTHFSPIDRHHPNMSSAPEDPGGGRIMAEHNKLPPNAPVARKPPVQALALQTSVQQGNKQYPGSATSSPHDERRMKSGLKSASAESSVTPVSGGDTTPIADPQAQSNNNNAALNSAGAGPGGMAQPSISMSNNFVAGKLRQGLGNLSLPGAVDVIPAHGPSPAPPPLLQREETASSIETPHGSQGTPFSNSDENKRSLFSGVYSSSGFDMIKVLMRVATRQNAEINIGAVDMSCAFVVCDVTQHDLPIVYCSDVFERLTGYSKHEILGRNCRFLQAPDGKVQSGVKRKYVDDDVVLQLKNKISARKEAQTSIINYRKGGQPFMNLLTLIPITMEPDDVHFKFYVGFQVDLVETPQSVTNKNPDGTYTINYQRGFLPRYVWQTPENKRHTTVQGQTIPRDDVSTVLTTIGSGESELSKRIWDKVLLENTDDVVHVLSLKGLFLYLSPSSRKVLEYDSTELVGTALSSVCHPSDIVPVTRELKDTSTATTVNVVFRIRRKNSGYTWFESHGSLSTEQGKGRKCIILVGRERPVYALSRNDILSAGGIGESELWTKMSTSGMFLYVSSNVRTLLDRQPEDLVGTSIQHLMRHESRGEFDRMLEKARTGVRVTVKHEMVSKRGQSLQANTVIYPGDAVEGQKPTFLVAQTKFSKTSRTMSLNASKQTPVSPRTDRASLGSSPATATGTPGAANSTGSQTPQPSIQKPDRPTPGLDTIITEPGGKGLPIGSQDIALASADNVFDELKTTRSTSWQFELRQMEKRNRLLFEELQSLQSSRKKRKRRKGAGQMQKDCANCHTRTTPEWRRGPSGNRDLCNSCGLRWAKQNGRVSPRTSSQQSDKKSTSPALSSPLGAGDPSHAANVQQNTSAGVTNMPPPERRSMSSTSGGTNGRSGPSMTPTLTAGVKSHSSSAEPPASAYEAPPTSQGLPSQSGSVITKIEEE